jgi:hypothetical protein
MVAKSHLAFISLPSGRLSRKEKASQNEREVGGNRG